MAIELRGLSYLGLRVPDVEAWAAFARGVMGMADAPGPAEPSDCRYLKVDDRRWRVACHPAASDETSGIAYAGFEVADRAAFMAAVAHLRDEGVEAAPGTEDEVRARGVGDLVWCRDPSGTRIEVCWGPTRDGPFVSPVGVRGFVTGSLGLGHYVLLVADLDANLDFYQRVLGFRLSDFVVLGSEMSVQFLRCSPRHHTVALTAVGPVDGVHHVAFELSDIDEVGRALDRARRAGAEITASLGRHRNDRMLSFYMRSPAGFEVELGCDARVVDDATWIANEFTGGDEWGHHGLTGDALAAAARPREAT